MEVLQDRRSFVKAAMQAEGVVVLEGTTTWCKQCKAIAPFVEQVSTQAIRRGLSSILMIREMVSKYPNAKFYQYDTEVAEDIAQELGVNMTVTGAKASALEKAIKENYDGDVIEQ
ncbi:hypothetical protein LTR37_015317 [Vermiconidia calcicola]|uniref:Uncharacterized protein n=1 Tax=Vermiconidia calcicola TaxID=1690605 RepID=A0ACC3MQZ7_9PEZI|nr:hypothetical protein LTR37_015317 [Vermiconidia calcicola]